MVAVAGKPAVWTPAQAIFDPALHMDGCQGLHTGSMCRANLHDGGGSGGRHGQGCCLRGGECQGQCSFAQTTCTQPHTCMADEGFQIADTHNGGWSGGSGSQGAVRRGMRSRFISNIHPVFVNVQYLHNQSSLSPTRHVMAANALTLALWAAQIRTMEAGAVAAVARVLFEGGQGWPEALQWMNQAANSPDKGHREVALVLLSALMERIGEAFVPVLMCVKACGGFRELPELVSGGQPAQKALQRIKLAATPPSWSASVRLLCSKGCAVMPSVELESLLNLQLNNQGVSEAAPWLLTAWDPEY